MTTQTDRPYLVVGSSQSEQAERSTVNPSAGDTQVRILIELQVISMLLREGLGITDDLARMRENVAASIT